MDGDERNARAGEQETDATLVDSQRLRRGHAAQRRLRWRLPGGGGLGVEGRVLLPNGSSERGVRRS